MACASSGGGVFGSVTRARARAPCRAVEAGSAFSPSRRSASARVRSPDAAAAAASASQTASLEFAVRDRLAQGIGGPGVLARRQPPRADEGEQRPVFGVAGGLRFELGQVRLSALRLAPHAGQSQRGEEREEQGGGQKRRPPRPGKGAARGGRR